MFVDLLEIKNQNKEEEQKKNFTQKVKSFFSNFITSILSVRNIFTKQFFSDLKEKARVLISLASFFILLMFFLIELLIKYLASIWVLKFLFMPVSKFLENQIFGQDFLIKRLESKGSNVKRSFLVALSFRNMMMKKTRSYVTVGGMAIGIGTIVFLVSIGYGLQNLVISRVARLEELRMADVTLNPSTNLVLDQEALYSIQSIQKVESVLPVVSTVGKVNFSGSVGEAVIYGVTSNYFSAADLNKVEGDFFETESFISNVEKKGIVAGATDEITYESASEGQLRREVVFNIEEGDWLRVRSGPGTDSEIIGYTKRIVGGFDGYEIWGETYPDNAYGSLGEDELGNPQGIWIQASFPIWEKVNGSYQEIVNEYGDQTWIEGYTAQIGIIIDESKSQEFRSVPTTGSVLGESTADLAVADSQVSSLSAVVVGTDEQGIEWVEVVTDSATDSAEKNLIEVTDNEKTPVVVNTVLLELIGFNTDTALGEFVGVQLVVLPNLRSDLQEPTNTQEMNFEIVGVVEDGEGPVMYMPFDVILDIGVDRYSQAKIIVDSNDSLPTVREQIDTLGYKTSSVADTVERIDQLFVSVRALLAVFGFVALSVASLGMFNTLTVSLMERTHEVGVMKAMGMKSNEVRELFLAEAMVMGVLGGVLGVFIGWLSGNLLSLLLSLFSVSRGVGYIDISYLPPLFVVIVLILSFLVGVVTGFYPAKRARKISALDALRYE